MILLAGWAELLRAPQIGFGDYATFPGGESVKSHHTKSLKGPTSQSSPSETADVARHATPEGTHVLLCDWHGKLVWKSHGGDRIQIGDPLWKNARGKAREMVRAAVASVTALSESRTLEVENDRGELFRLWMWPLNEPDFALCVLAIQVPAELGLLSTLR